MKQDNPAGRESVEVETGWGSLRASGSIVVIMLLIVAGFAMLLLNMRDQDARADEREIRSVERAGKITTQISTIKDSMDENTYVQTLTADQKKALRLDMPASLRKKVRINNGED